MAASIGFLSRTTAASYDSVSFEKFYQDNFNCNEIKFNFNLFYSVIEHVEVFGEIFS
jgi:hypothetical protein